MDDLTEREKMLAGQLYRATDPELVAARAEARRLVHAYNATDPEATTLTWSLTTSHTCGGTIDPTTGVYTFAAINAGSCVVAVVVCDAAGACTWCAAGYGFSAGACTQCAPDSASPEGCANAASPTLPSRLASAPLPAYG